LQFPNKTLLLAVCAACIGGTFQYGYNISIINSPTKPIQNFINETWLQRYNTYVSKEILTLLWSSIVSIFTLGGFIGASTGGALAIRYGRKGTLLVNNIFALLASLLMGLSHPTGLFELLIAGRFLIGLNAGIGICVQPLYLGEIAPRCLRGAMAMGTSVFITGGILTGQVIGLKELLGAEQYWPILLFLQLIILPWFPESPRYLLIDRGNDLACNKALKRLHGSENYHDEREDIEKERLTALGTQSKKPWELFMDKNLRLQVITVILLNSAQQLNGINAIYFYASYVFTRAGIPDARIPYVTIGTGACECLTALTCVREASPWVPYLSMMCVFAFILSFGLGPAILNCIEIVSSVLLYSLLSGGVTNILTTEMFTQTARPAAYMIAGSVNWMSFFLIGMIFPFIVNGLQQYCFLVFLVICSLVALYIFFIVPETKNKTFLEIQEEFDSHSRIKLCKRESVESNGDILLSPPL
ncbi:GTR11 protein, partial [Atractosteus spatula]|nr:GTR11 protein [Atractosteus spatula]